jgi:hypothetical protein
MTKGGESQGERKLIIDYLRIPAIAGMTILSHGVKKMAKGGESQGERKLIIDY